MYLLSLADYAVARPLFAGLDDHLAVAAILEGSAPAALYVDHPIRPCAAFTWTGYRFFLTGSPAVGAFSQAVRGLLMDTVFPQTQAAGLEMIELAYAPEGWADAITGVILRDKAPILARRHYYVYHSLRHDWRSVLPAGYRLTRIDAGLLAQDHIYNLDALREELCSERPSVADFLARSFGIAALYGDELAGWCTSEYNTGDRCEVGIGTLEPHQRRGLATAMGSAFIEHAAARGIRHIGWHCWARNQPSVATALTIGYEKAAEHSTFITWLASG